MATGIKEKVKKFKLLESLDWFEEDEDKDDPEVLIQKLDENKDTGVTLSIYSVAEVLSGDLGVRRSSEMCSVCTRT